MDKKQGMERFLLRKAVQGDSEAFGEIIKRYQHPVYAVAVQITRDRGAAQDIAQDTFISAFKALKNLRSENSFAPWLRSIARNLALSWRKEQGRFASLEAGGTLASSSKPPRIEAEAESVEAEAFRGEVEQILSSLSDALRFPILLCYLNDLPTAEAARFLGIKESTLRKRLHDGKEKAPNEDRKDGRKHPSGIPAAPGFANRCICGCRVRLGKKEQELGREVMKMGSKKNSCGCGCIEVKKGNKASDDKKTTKKSK